jgi:uncharacterized protein YjbJ (UPF0337 family)
MGILEEGKGKIKQAVGDLTDNDDLKREGKAQRARGEAEREATKERASAKVHETKAKAYEAEERAAQDR